MAPVSPAEAAHETRVATRLLLFALALLVIAALAFVIWGLPALAMIGLVGTLTVFVLLIAYAAGL